MTTAALESLADQAFDQLEDGPLVEGLYAFYLSIAAEIEGRMAIQIPAPAQVEDLGSVSPAFPEQSGPEEKFLQAAG